MYEQVTYEDILKRLLERVPAKLDRREGSVIYDALAPCAMELKLMYNALDDVIDDTFADTASREFLIRRAAERGLSPKAASTAVVRGAYIPQNALIEDGARFSANGIYYRAQEAENGVCKLICEAAGSLGNALYDELIPVENVSAPVRMSAVELLIPGEDEEDTEAFRARYLASFESHAFGGNVDDYEELVGSVAGVGAVRVVPVWKGGGTVLIQILDSEFNAASAELIGRVQELIDPANALGEGLAPIGHSVTVSAPSEVSIDVSFELVLDAGYSADALRARICDAIADYFLSLRRQWAERGGSVVRVSQIETRVMSVEGVVDISGTLICGQSGNYELTADEIPVAGVIDFG